MDDKKKNDYYILGDIGRKFYIILKGSVHVLIKKVGIEAAKPTATEDEKGSHEPKDKKLNSLVHKVMKDNLKKMDTGYFSQTLYDQISSKKNTKKGAFFSNPLEDMPMTEYLNLCFPALYKVRTLGQGDSFGELALRESVPR